MKILVTGDRFWDDYDVILRELTSIPSGSIIIHGGCRGADIIAGEIAKALGHTVRDYPADWTRYRRAAGPIRNRQMLRVENLPEEPIDLVLGFHKNIDESRGTKDMLEIATRAGVQTNLVKG